MNERPEVLTQTQDPAHTADWNKVFGPQIDPGEQSLVAPSGSTPRPRVVSQAASASAAMSQDMPVVLRHTEEVALLFDALSKAQGLFGDVEKTLQAKVESRREGAKGYAYKYETLADVLEVVRPHLSSNGLAVLQFPFTRAQHIQIRTVVTHSSGQMLWSDLVANISGLDPQAVGSGISYMRRYALKSILGIAATEEDDDGQLASRGREQVEPIRQAERKSQNTTSVAAGRPDVLGPPGVPLTAQPQQAVPPPQAQAAPKSVPVPAEVVDPDVAAAAIASPIGLITGLEEKSNGWYVTLDSGFCCGTRDKDLLAKLYNFRSANARVHLVAPTPREGYLPRLAQVLIAGEPLSTS